MRRPRAVRDESGSTFSASAKSCRPNPRTACLQHATTGNAHPGYAREKEYAKQGGNAALIGTAESIRGTTGTMSQENSISISKTVTNFLLQLVFWPVSLCLILTRAIYRIVLLTGARKSPVRFRHPPLWLVGMVSLPLRILNPPVVVGGINLRTVRSTNADVDNMTGEASKTPTLLVGNHAIYGLDCMAMLFEVQRRTGVYLRVLYDTLFSYIPIWRQVAEAAGGASGTRGNCEALMRERTCLLLYPGGAREAFKRGTDDKYRLMWSEKLGFVRLAVKHGYDVLPFASIGIEDAVRVGFSAEITWIVRRAERDRGKLRLPFLLPYNSLERQYFAFGKAIDTTRYEGDWENSRKCEEVYKAVRGEVERLTARLQDIRRNDPNRYFARRAWRTVKQLLGFLKEPLGTLEHT